MPVPAGPGRAGFPIPCLPARACIPCQLLPAGRQSMRARTHARGPGMAWHGRQAGRQARPGSAGRQAGSQARPGPPLPLPRAGSRPGPGGGAAPGHASGHGRPAEHLPWQAGPGQACSAFSLFFQRNHGAGQGQAGGGMRGGVFFCGCHCGKIAGRFVSCCGFLRQIYG